MRIGPNRYSEYVAVSGEDVRFAVLTCLDCGAAVLYGLDDNGPEIHDQWHAKQDDWKPA